MTRAKRREVWVVEYEPGRPLTDANGRAITFLTDGYCAGVHLVPYVRYVPETAPSPRKRRRKR